MRDLLLFAATIAIFVYGYFVMKKVDEFIEKNQKLTLMESKDNYCKIKIAAESPIQLDYVSALLETCSEANPYIEFFFLSGKASRLLQQLKEESIDIVLLSDITPETAKDDFGSAKIHYENSRESETALGLPFENIDENSCLYIVWNKNVKSKIRDRVIIALENEQFRSEK